MAAAGVAVLALALGFGASVYGLLQARAQRAVAEQRSVQLEQVAAFQQSMLEGIDIESMGIGMADALRQQVAATAPADLGTFERGLAHASTADVARGLIDRDILASAEHAVDRDFATQPLLAADLRESVARVRQALGLPAAAAAEFARVAEARARSLGAGDPATLRARQQQASALLEAADAKSALALARASLRDGAALVAADPLRLRLRLSEAEAIAALGDRRQARQALERLRADALELRGERDPATLEIGNSLAILLGRMGEADAGRRLLEALLPLRTQVLGESHPDTLASLHNLAVMRIMTGDQDGAVALQRGLVRMQTRRLGAEHPQTLSERGNLASMLTDSGKLEEALPIAQAVLDARVRVLGAEHPQTLRARLNLATVHARMQHYAAAISLQQEVLEARRRLLGARHPDTLFIALNLAATLHQAGQSQASLDLLAQVLPVARQVLGDKHPQLHMGYDIRAQDADELGDRPLAIASWRTLLDLRAAAFGADDARTVDAAWQLEGLLRQGGDQAAADAVRSAYVEPLLRARPADLDAARAAKRQDIIETEREEARAARRVSVR
jgi:non-specific serine/threonine protein kinase/serine/threonine-protein kinase